MKIYSAAEHRQREKGQERKAMVLVRNDILILQRFLQTLLRASALSPCNSIKHGISSVNGAVHLSDWLSPDRGRVGNEEIVVSFEG